jgi:hypothetical protein
MRVNIVHNDRRARCSLGSRWLPSTALVWIVMFLQCNWPPGFAQGLFDFVNYYYFAGKPLIDEPISVLDPATGDCIRPFGDDWHAEVLAAVPAKGLGLTRLWPTLEFAPPFGPGYLGHVFEVPGSQGGDIAEVYLRAFQGPDFDAAAVRGIAGPFTVPLVSAPGTPNEVFLPPGSLDMCIPEPSTMALVAVGIVALCFGRDFTARGATLGPVLRPGPSAVDLTQRVHVNRNTESPTSQFHGPRAVDPWSGWVAVSWHDCRNDASNESTQLFAAVSKDGFSTRPTSNVQINPAFSNSHQPSCDESTYINYGDYVGLAFHGRVLLPVWCSYAGTGDSCAEVHACRLPW